MPLTDLRPLLEHVQRDGMHDGVDTGETVFVTPEGWPTQVVTGDDAGLTVHTSAVGRRVRAPFFVASAEEQSEAIGSAINAAVAGHLVGAANSLGPALAEAVRIASFNPIPHAFLVHPTHGEAVEALVGEHPVYVSPSIAGDALIAVPPPQSLGYLATRADGSVAIVVGFVQVRALSVAEWRPMDITRLVSVPEFQRMGEVPPHIRMQMLDTHTRTPELRLRVLDRALQWPFHEDATDLSLTVRVALGRAIAAGDEIDIRKYLPLILPHDQPSEPGTPVWSRLGGDHL